MVKKAAKVSMPTLATGTSTDAAKSRLAFSGFSLLELLVVVTIIAIFAGAAVLSIGSLGRDRELEREASRLQSVIDLLQEEAVMESRDYGVLFSESGYRFYVYDQQQAAWLTLANDRLLAERILEAPVRLSLELDAREALLPQDFELRPNQQPEPQVVILASGELTPFDVSLYRDLTGGRFRLSAELNGMLTLTQDGFDAP